MHELVSTLLTYLRAIWHKRWYGLLAAWLVCLIGWAYVLSLPNEYSASAKVYIDTQSALRPLLRNMTIQNDPATQISLMTRTLLSRPNLEKIARITDLDLTATNTIELDQLLNNLRDHIRIRALGRRSLFQIEYESESPIMAKKVVQALLTLFVENTLGETRQDTDSAQRFLERQISDYEARLVSAEQRLVDFKRRNYQLLPGNEGGFFQRMGQLERNISELKEDISQAEQAKQLVTERLISQRELLDSLSAEELVFDPNVELPTDARIAQTQQNLDGLLLRYTDRHPDVQLTRQLLAELKKQRIEEEAEYLQQQRRLLRSQQEEKTQNNQLFQDLSLALTNIESKIKSLTIDVNQKEQALAQLQDQLHLIPEVEAQMQALDRDYSVLQDNYQQLISSREKARLSSQAESTADDIRFRIIEPPRAPAEPTGPDRVQYASVVLFFALILALGCAFLVSQLRATFLDARSLTAVTQVPVFGVVSILRTPTELRRKRMSLIAFLTLLVLLFVVYSGLIIFAARYMN